jgi:hypothetical protein
MMTMRDASWLRSPLRIPRQPVGKSDRRIDAYPAPDHIDDWAAIPDIGEATATRLAVVPQSEPKFAGPLQT